MVMWMCALPKRLWSKITLVYELISLRLGGGEKCAGRLPLGTYFYFFQINKWCDWETTSNDISSVAMREIP